MVRLIAVTAELHVFRQEINWDQPLRLGFCLSDGRLIRMWQQRGDQVGFDDRPLEPEDFGDVGRVEVHDITERLDERLRDAPVGAPKIIATAAGEPVGLALPRPGQEAFCLWIRDGSLHWGDAGTLAADRTVGGWTASIGDALPRDRQARQPG
jgi:hypothetical protein